jgi:SAM-dependent MidA family methyltransferase
MLLSGIIIEKIKREGAISFHDFMEMALYYPDLGYYTSPSDKIGENGDFYTSTTLTPVFGALIGKQIEEMWHLLDEKPFAIVEYGAGTGALCKAILTYLKSNKKLYDELSYYIIEKSPAMREKEKMQLTEKVTWCDSIECIPEISGCVLSNELVDNFAVHQVVMKDELMEVFVGYENDSFVELLKPAFPALKEYLSELKVNLPKGYRTEINLEAIEWIKKIGDTLKKGYVLTIDYGYPSFELYESYRQKGTMVCYHKHRINTNPYAFIGGQDITSHVNFSALCLWGYKNGLEFCGFTDQADFLLALGFNDYLKKIKMGNEYYSSYKNELFLSHTLLTDMGNKFKVLIQQKGVPKKELLGLKHVLTEHAQ